MVSLKHKIVLYLQFPLIATVLFFPCAALTERRKLGTIEAASRMAYAPVAQGIEHSPPKREVERFPKTAFQAHTSEYAPVPHLDRGSAS